MIEFIFMLTRDDVTSLTAMSGVYGLDLLAYRHRTAEGEALAADRPVVRAVSDAVAAQVNRRPALCGLDTWDDNASLIHEAGITAVSCGPGSNYQAYAVDEYVPIEELLDCAQALARSTRHWLHQPVQK